MLSIAYRPRWRRDQQRLICGACRCRDVSTSRELDSRCLSRPAALDLRIDDVGLLPVSPALFIMYYPLTIWCIPSRISNALSFPRIEVGTNRRPATSLRASRPTALDLWCRVLVRCALRVSSRLLLLLLSTYMTSSA